MRWMTTRGMLAVGACALALSLLSAPARAGTITLSYGLFGYSAETTAPPFPTTLVGGPAVLTVTAFRSGVSASFGFISGGTLSYLSVAGGPTHVFSGPTAWTVGAFGGAYGAPGVGPVFLPSIMGMFSGLNSAGTAFSAGFFSFANGTPPTAPPTPNALVGNFNFAGGAFAYSGFLGLAASGTDSAGAGAVCFNAFAGVGPCATYPGFYSTFGPSGPGPGTVPGFAASGAEVSRTVAIEPVPEPTTALLLGLGLTGLAAAARRTRRG